MAVSDTSFNSFMQKSGQSLTKQRQLIFNYLKDREPLGINDLIKLVEAKMDRASVYRTIRLFEKLGITQRVYHGWKYKIELSDKFTEHHHHITCRKCKKVIPINEVTLEDFIRKVASQYRFSAETHQVEIQGLCSECSQQS